MQPPEALRVRPGVTREPALRSTDLAEQGGRLQDHVYPGQWRWAIYDRKARTLFYGPSDISTDLTVAEQSGLLQNPPEYYRPGTGHVLGGYLCCSTDGCYYFDPFSGTFPGTVEGVADAEAALAEICHARSQRSRLFAKTPEAVRVRPKPPA